MTVWKSIPIPNVSRLYMASDDGQIKKLAYSHPITNKHGLTYLRTHKEKLLKQRMGKPSFKGIKDRVVTIYLGNSRENNASAETRVCYIVCAAFHGMPWSTPAERMQFRIRFKDGDRMNCAADNLEWVHHNGESGSDSIERVSRNEDAFKSRIGNPPAWVIEMYGEEAA